MATSTATTAGRVASYLRFVKIEHSLFALPLVLIGGLEGFRAAGAAPLAPEAWPVWGLIVLAAVAARTAAMALNRIVDRHIDARNPRTAARELPAGRLKSAEAWALVVVSFAVLFLAAWRLNPLCLALAPVLVALFTLYPYAKRFTAGAHFVLGAAWACGPAGGFLAVTGGFAGSTAVAALAAAAFLWVAGFDILYALLDVDFDRAHRLHSVPARVGPLRGLRLARGLHGLVVVLFALFGWLAGLGWPYWLAWLVVAALLHYEHARARRLDAASINIAFFHVNAAIGWIVLAGVVAGRLA